MDGNQIKPNGAALIPFAVFAAFYVGLSLFAAHLGFEMPWYKVSMPVAFLVASAVSLVLGRRSLDEKVETYARGMGDQNIMVMCLVFILAGAFATIAKECAEKFKVDPVRVASVLDTASCVVQGLIPYGAQILIAMGVAKGLEIQVDSLSLAKSLYYQPLLALAVLLSMLKWRGHHGSRAVDLA